MKKLVFSLMVLFLTSENIARGSFFQLGLGYDYFRTYDFLNRGIQKILPSNNFKFNFNPKLLSINKKIKIYLYVSVGFSSRSFHVTKNQIEEYKNVMRSKGEKIRSLYIDQNIVKGDPTIIFTPIKKSQEKNGKVSIRCFFLDETEYKHYDLKDKEVKELLTPSLNKKKTTILPYDITGIYFPCSIGISTRIKINKKTFIKIELRGYIGFNYLNLYTTILNDLIDWVPGIAYETLDKNDSFKQNKAKSFFGSLYLTLIYNDISYRTKYFYGGIFNITISSKIYKHIEINISLSSLEFCYVKDPIGEEEKTIKQTTPFNGKNYALFYHLPGFGILLF